MTDIEIAQKTKLIPIAKVAEKLGIKNDELEPYGNYKAKINNEFSSSAVFRHRTLEDYFKIFLKHKFILVDYNEPVPDKKQTEISYRIARLAQIPLFLFMEWAK
jgi:hypothetical protein